MGLCHPVQRYTSRMRCVVNVRTMMYHECAYDALAISSLIKAESLTHTHTYGTRIHDT